MKRMVEKLKHSVYGKMALVFLLAALVAAILFVLDNSKGLAKNRNGESVLERNPPGGGTRKEELEVQIGELEDSYTVGITERKFTAEELQKEFETAEKQLETLILGKNKSLDEVRSNLNLVGEIPDTGIKVAWELDNYEVMNLQGEIQPEALTESGVLLRLIAYLSYGEEKVQYSFYAHLYPPRLTRAEKVIQKLETEIAQLDEASGEQAEMPLPSSLEGAAVGWKYATDFRAVGVLVLGAALAMLVYAAEEQKKKDAEKARNRQLELDYPQLVSRITLYMGAGMTVRKAWFKLAEDYEAKEKQKGQREVYKEMVYTMHEMQSGASEQECYERFGERCGLTLYRKFGTLLSQNLKKGTRGLVELLRQEAVNAFEERKSLAKRLGEEAGTKLLLPMFLMLGAVLLMIIVPAFFSMQI